MVNGVIVQAMDWRKRKGESHGRYSYRDGDQWYFVEHGPGFQNVHRVTAYDEDGLRFLERIERKGVSDAQNGAVQP